MKKDVGNLYHTQTHTNNLEATTPKNYTFQRCKIHNIKDFVEENHYSKNVNGLICDFCFCLTYKDKLIAAMIYGRMAMASVWKKYEENESDVIELRRLCCIDDTLKNTESYFIAQSIKYLTKRTTIKTIVSYADLSFGHVGTIYKASNFKLVGKTAEGRVIIYRGKRYHDKAIRTKYNGKIKPFSKEIIRALETKEAYYIKTKPKNIYLYKLRKKKRPKQMKQLTMF